MVLTLGGTYSSDVSKVNKQNIKRHAQRCVAISHSVVESILSDYDDLHINIFRNRFRLAMVVVVLVVSSSKVKMHA